jgi:hypothetical protein
MIFLGCLVLGPVVLDMLAVVLRQAIVLRDAVVVVGWFIVRATIEFESINVDKAFAFLEVDGVGFFERHFG